MTRRITYNVAGFTGWDVFLNLLPSAWQAKAVAKRLMTSVYKGVDPEETPFYIVLGNKTFHVKDKSGAVQACAKEP